MSRDEDKDLQEAAKALGLSEVLPAVYNDLLSPAAKELGQGLAVLASAVRVALAPVEGAVWGFDRIRDWLAVRVTAILAERRVEDVQEAPLSVAGPLLMQMVFASREPDLREMYAKLLATAMDPQKEKEAHPSFVYVIQQLSSSEARILQHIARIEDSWPCWSGNQETFELQSNLHAMCADAGISDKDLADTLIDNMLRLRILWHFVGTDVKYQPEGHNRFGGYDPSVESITTEYIELTDYGKQIIRVCV